MEGRLDDRYTSATPPPPDAGGQNELQQIQAEISYLNGLMAEDRVEIERLRAESQVLKTETREILRALGARL